MKRLTAVLITGALMVSSLPQYGAALDVPVGTKVLVRLDENVSSATHHKGDTLSMRVAADVTLDGRKVIAAEAPAVGVVMNASKRFIAGIGGQLDIQVQKVQAVDGSWIPVQYTKGAHNGSSLVSVVLTVVCCICFIFIPGKDVSIEKGTIFETAVVAAPVPATTPAK